MTNYLPHHYLQHVILAKPESRYFAFAVGESTLIGCPIRDSLTVTGGNVSRQSPRVIAFAFASEIGPGFSPDIPGPQKHPGFSPWDMLSSLISTNLGEAIPA